MPGSGASNRSWSPQPADLPLRARAADARTPSSASGCGVGNSAATAPPAQDATPAKGNLGVARTSTFQAHSMPVSIDESPAKRRPSCRRRHAAALASPDATRHLHGPCRQDSHHQLAQGHAAGANTLCRSLSQERSSRRRRRRSLFEPASRPIPTRPSSTTRGLRRGAALLRRRPNQSLRQRGRRQLDPSRRGEGAAEGTGGRWYLCRQRRLGVFRWYSRAWWRVSVRINAPAARGGLRTVATAAKCHRAPVDYHPVAGQMPTGLQ